MNDDNDRLPVEDCIPIITLFSILCWAGVLFVVWGPA